MNKMNEVLTMHERFQKRLAKERGKLLIRYSDNKILKAVNHEDQLTADSSHLVHKLRAKDSTGRWAYYFILVSKSREFLFLNKLKNNETMDLEQYGQVLASNYGKKPSVDVINMLKNRYGWEIEVMPEKDND